MKLKEITDCIETVAPLAFQESYDNSGLLIGNKNTDIKGILICIDCTEEIVDEAIQRKCNLIVAHHPIIFDGLKQITGKNYVERTVLKAIKNDIAIYAAHTNLDNVSNGVNKKIANKIGLKNTEILVPKNNFSNVGSGMIGEISKKEKANLFLKKLKQTMQTDCIRHTSFSENIFIKKVAICGGSGSFLLDDAISARADIFITADFKYHQFFDAENKLIIADIGHYESEQFTKELFYDILIEKFPKSVLHLSKINTNPINYL
ncbi:MAG: Nif3-like dinuclear metal center hexameric protein [Bacteroidia bacterium]